MVTKKCFNCALYKGNKISGTCGQSGLFAAAACKGCKDYVKKTKITMELIRQKTRNAIGPGVNFWAIINQAEDTWIIHITQPDLFSVPFGHKVINATT
jgi:hypothetical protein